MVHESKLSKSIEESDDPFFIASDQGNRDDPDEPSHVKAFFSRKVGAQELIYGERIIELTRSSEMPYLVSLSGRSLTLSDIPDGTDYSLKILLGRDFGFDELGREEKLYYSGVVNGIEVRNQEFLVSGRVTSQALVPMRTFFEEGAEVLTIQGFCDFSGIPLILDEADIPENFGKTAITNMTALTADDSSLDVSYGARNLVLAERSVPNSQFFIASDVLSETLGLIVSSESGPPINFVLKSYFSREDLIGGKTLLVDFETTIGVSFAQVYLNTFESELRNDLFERTIARTTEFFRILMAKANSTEDITINLKEFSSYSAIYAIAKQSNLGDATGRLLGLSTLSPFLATKMTESPELVVNQFFFSKGQARQVTIDSGTATFVLTASIDETDPQQVIDSESFFSQAVLTPALIFELIDELVPSL